MLASAGDISLEQVLSIIFGTLSGPLALCMLMLSRSFSTPSMLMVMFSILGYLRCDIVGRCSVSSSIVKTDLMIKNTIILNCSYSDIIIAPCFYIHPEWFVISMFK